VTLDPSKQLPGNRRLGRAWLALCVALAAHVVDEAANDFLAVYNPTALELRARLPWLPIPVFRFEWWISGLVVAVVTLVLLSAYVFRGARWTRPAAYALGILMTGNSVLHLAGTVLGRTVDSVRFDGPMPGVYSAPLLLAASLYLLSGLWKTRRV
jgi:hypothetical protein